MDRGNVTRVYLQDYITNIEIEYHKNTKTINIYKTL